MACVELVVARPEPVAGAAGVSAAGSSTAGSSAAGSSAAGSSTGVVTVRFETLSALFDHAAVSVAATPSTEKETVVPAPPQAALTSTTYVPAAFTAVVAQTAPPTEACTDAPAAAAVPSTVTVPAKRAGGLGGAP